MNNMLTKEEFLKYGLPENFNPFSCPVKPEIPVKQEFAKDGKYLLSHHYNYYDNKIEKFKVPIGTKEIIQEIHCPSYDDCVVISIYIIRDVSKETLYQEFKEAMEEYNKNLKIYNKQIKEFNKNRELYNKIIKEKEISILENKLKELKNAK